MFIEVDGIRLHAVSFGDGPRTLLAVGGWTGSWELWEQPFEQLTGMGWRCVGYDHRGSGESPADPARLTVDGLVDEVRGVMDALGIDRCVLAGESMGGAVAQHAAVRWPERLEGLALVAPRPATAPVSDAFAAACVADYPAAVASFVDACLPEPGSDHLRRWGRDILLRAEPEQAARMLTMWADPDLPLLDPRDIGVPTVILHGTADVIVPIDGSRSLAATIPGATLLELPDAGHVPTLTRPDEVVGAIRTHFG